MGPQISYVHRGPYGSRYNEGDDEIGGNRIRTSGVHHLAINQRSLQSFLSNFTMADVEVVDPKKCLEESCKPKCVKPILEYLGVCQEDPR
ncbi:BnaC02g33620D [Brassica napus]|uniref:(rape) hypothetical protein n=1 Tax=Brassica napus TaxID=3708 RepID=A0A078HJ33_BRANA|nr:unnamed protein product [Brassica napus]CDY37344.1 BnaC02g33620D [Brassica napus]